MKLIETIVAQATAPGTGGIGIVRVSGPLVSDIALGVLGSLPQPRVATFFSFLDAQQIPLDQGIALFFKAPHSFTGEDVLELQGHGGGVVIDQVIKRILQLGARLARPGEFSERAFLNDKIDLVQAEAIADLIGAANEEAARAAMRSLQGEFSAIIHTQIEALVKLRMYVEAAIDFAEEEINFLKEPHLKQALDQLIFSFADLKKQAMQGSLLKEGIQVVLAGKPNAGKSTLLNCLSEKEIAIVTDIPGTTRDLIRHEIQIDGLPLHVIDTAGLRNSANVIEQEGIRRAYHEMQNADLVLWIRHANEKVDETFSKAVDSLNVPVIMVSNKIDLAHLAPGLQLHSDYTEVLISAKHRLGISFLKQAILTAVGFNKENQGNFLARRRHLTAIESAYELLQQAALQLEAGAGELAAEDLRVAQKVLGEITGEFSSDDLLGRIFSSFCIGK